MNHISLIGRVGKEPEFKYFESGNCVANFPLAVRRNKGETDWFQCSAWGKQGELVKRFVKNGDQIGITGSIHIYKYTDRNGQSRISANVEVSSISLIENRDETADQLLRGKAEDRQPHR